MKIKLKVKKPKLIKIITNREGLNYAATLWGYYRHVDHGDSENRFMITPHRDNPDLYIFKWGDGDITTMHITNIWNYMRHYKPANVYEVVEYKKIDAINRKKHEDNTKD